MSAKQLAPHEHELHRFNCLETIGTFPRVLYICFACGRAFTQKITYVDVGVKVE